MTDTFLSVPHRRLAALLRPVTPGFDDSDPPTAEALEKAFARAAFSTLIEPGDPAANALITALGIRTALRALVEEWSPAEVLERVRAAPPEGEGASAMAVRDRLGAGDGDGVRMAESGITLVGGGAAPADDECTVAGEVHAGVGDGRTAASGGRVSADGGFAVAGDGRTIPSGGRVSADGGFAVAGDGRMAASGGRVSADGGFAPAGDERTIAGDRRTIPSGGRVSADGGFAPADDERTVAGDRRTIANDERVDAADTLAAADSDSAFAGNDLTPLTRALPANPALTPPDDSTISASAPAPEDHPLLARIEEAFARWRPRLSLAAAIRSLETAANVGAWFLTPEHALWPSRLETLGEAAPIALWIRGDPERLVSLERSLSLVGARAATGYGEHVAMESAAGLSDRGFAIVSGGAYGIDGAAHRAALVSGQVTVAFLAGGVDRLYPAGHSDLLRRVAEHGLLVGELPCGSTPTRWRFLSRNRLIAAASSATIVIEAGRRSGSLNTAGHAAELGRPLGAVPGPVTSPASAGCHRLIREYAATCVTTVEEMAELAEPIGSGFAEEGRRSGQERHPHSPDARLLTVLSPRRPHAAEELAALTGLAHRDVAAVLGRLEIEGLAREEGAGWLRTRSEGRG